MINHSLPEDLIKLYEDQDIQVKLYVAARSRLLKLGYYLQILPHDGSIVDVGCGYGVLANYLSLNLPASRITGIDLNSKRIAAAARTIGIRSNIKFIEYDATKWDWPKCTGIIMPSFLHHISPTCQKSVLEKASQSLEKGGVLLIHEVDPAARPFYRYWDSYLSDRILYPFSKSYFRTSGYWHGLLNDLGFEVKTDRPRSAAFAGIVYVCCKV